MEYSNRAPGASSPRPPFYQSYSQPSGPGRLDDSRGTHPAAQQPSQNGSGVGSTSPFLPEEPQATAPSARFQDFNNLRQPLNQPWDGMGHSMQRYLTQTPRERPWNHQGDCGMPPSTSHSPGQNLHPNRMHPDHQLQGYVSGHSMTSINSPPFTSSSGYRTQLTTPSVVSAPPREYIREPDHPVPSGRPRMTSLGGHSPGAVSRTISEPSQRSSRGSGKQKYHQRQCPHCRETPRCQSDWKKHAQKHEKPYRCEVEGCMRHQGFTTPNDLERHQKSVHKMRGRTKSWKCAAPRCKSKGKIWPRLDNFKQHLTRMHKEEDVDELLKTSECKASASSSPPTPAQPSLREPPAENLIAGMDDPSRNNMAGAYSHPSSLSLTPEQPPVAWEGYGVGDPPEYGQDDNQQGTAPFPYAPGPPATDHCGDHGQSLPGPDGPFGIPPPILGLDGSNEIRRGLLSPAMLAHAASAVRESDMDRSGNLSSQSLTGQDTTSVDSVPYTDPQLDALNVMTNYLATGQGHNPPPPDTMDQVLRMLSSATGIDLIEPLPDGAFHSGPQDSPELQSPREPSRRTRRSSSPEEETSSDDEHATTQNILSSTQFVKGILNLAKIIERQKGKKTTSAVVDSMPVSGKGKKCPKCPKIVSRTCEMNKHMKRHTRPYGCTFPQCNKKFGSKNDWKRHENSQHFQLENWRCEMATPAGDKCAMLFYDADSFRHHLRDEHRVEEAKATDELKRCCIGKNGQGRFWCGFCHAIIPLKQREEKAWHERFDHIEREHFRQNQEIKDWICLETNKPKGEMEKEMNKKNFDCYDAEDEEPTQDDTTTEDASSAEQGQIFSGPAGAPPGTIAPSDLASSYTSSKSTAYSRKRPADESFTNAASSSEVVLYCCQCGQGPFESRLYTTCGLVGNGCDHEFCQQCHYKRQKVG